jgi:hypothetical protein
MYRDASFVNYSFSDVLALGKRDAVYQMVWAVLMAVLRVKYL